MEHYLFKIEKDNFVIIEGSSDHNSEGWFINLNEKSSSYKNINFYRADEFKRVSDLKRITHSNIPMNRVTFISLEEVKEILGEKLFHVVNQDVEECGSNFEQEANKHQDPNSFLAGYLFCERKYAGKQFTERDLKDAYQEGALDMIQTDDETTVQQLFELKKLGKVSWSLNKSWDLFLTSLELESRNSKWEVIIIPDSGRIVLVS